MARARIGVPSPITLLALPPDWPELNPVERVRLNRKQRSLSHRLLAAAEAIVDAAGDAWARLTAEVGRIRSLCSYPVETEGQNLGGRYYSSAAAILSKFALRKGCRGS